MRKRRTKRNPVRAGNSVAQQIEIDLIEDSFLIVVGVGVVGLAGYLVWKSLQDAATKAADAAVNMLPAPESPGGQAIGFMIDASDAVDNAVLSAYHSVFGPSTALQQTE